MFLRTDKAKQRMIGHRRGIPRMAISVFIVSLVVVGMVVMFERPAAMSWQVGPKAQQGNTNAKRARKKAVRGGEGGLGKIKRPGEQSRSVMPDAESSSLGMGPGGVPLRSYEFETVKLDSAGTVVGRGKWQGRYFVEDLGGGVTLEMAGIAGGSFLMGTAESEMGQLTQENQRYISDIKVRAQLAEITKWQTPQHRVTVRAVWMGKFEVTQRQWRAVALMPRVDRDLNTEPSHFKGDDLPVEQVSWDDAVEFCARLSHKTGLPYRLPSEAEWEYACRAGTTTAFSFGETITPDLENYNGNYPWAEEVKGAYREKTVAVGSLGAANGFGLYDMHGNVLEWCIDNWHENYTGAPSDGSVWKGGDIKYRMLRGGCWASRAYNSRSAFRGRAEPSIRHVNIGFRVVLAVRT
jgi:formylglycine-generating enzyme required for sulfatase activity